MSEVTLEAKLAEKLDQLAVRHRELMDAMNRPDVASNPVRLVELNKEFSRLRRVVDPYLKYKAVLSDLRESDEILNDRNQDADLRELAESEYPELERRCRALAEQVREALVTANDASVRSIIVEIRAGTGGQEAALFAGDLYQMYQRYCEDKGFKVEVLGQSAGEMGGFKEIILNITGEGVYQRLGYEGGGHRVQRVPITESQGRVHTSAATVAVLPEPEEVDIRINWDEDVEEFTSRSSGPGGQNVNKVESAIRLVHKESGITVSMRDEKSQHKNRSKARRILLSRLNEHHLQAQKAERASVRKAMVGSGDRSERIRTYNFPQNRCTEHRIGLTLYNLDQVMMGALDEIIESLQRYDRSERLRSLSTGNLEGSLQ